MKLLISFRLKTHQNICSMLKKNRRFFLAGVPVVLLHLFGRVKNLWYRKCFVEFQIKVALSGFYLAFIRFYWKQKEITAAFSAGLRRLRAYA